MADNPRVPLPLNLLGLGLPQVMADYGADLREARQAEAQDALRQAFGNLLGGQPGPFQGGLVQPDFAGQTSQQQADTLAGLAGAGFGGLAQGLAAQQAQAGFSPERQRAMLNPVQRQQLQNAEQAFTQSEAMFPLQLAAAQLNLQAQQLAAAGQIAPEFSESTARLNGRYLQQIQAPVEVADAVRQVQGALETGSSLGGLAAIIKLAKILDPTSVVREGEVTTVQGGIGIADQLVSTWNRLTGQGLTPEAAEAIRQIVDRVASPILARGRKITEDAQRAADMLGVPRSLVLFGGSFSDPGALSSGPAAGADGVIDLTGG